MLTLPPPLSSPLLPVLPVLPAPRSLGGKPVANLYDDLMSRRAGSRIDYQAECGAVMLIYDIQDPYKDDKDNAAQACLAAYAAIDLLLMHVLKKIDLAPAFLRTVLRLPMQLSDLRLEATKFTLSHCWIAAACDLHVGVTAMGPVAALVPTLPHPLPPPLPPPPPPPPVLQEGAPPPLQTAVRPLPLAQQQHQQQRSICGVVSSSAQHAVFELA
ncbi:hypothetical protein JKP88DRAFT_283112 [Tribonema minus]|uniref:Uncharacterized protein n=1 Tax=Tribonema minus TaxID=303371 RepID=A0A836C7Z0_9STRA|nr:hypothetical protein JKP88DRAFT_283112 [Tribonema minus]